MIPVMHPTNDLGGVDLNLLVVLDAVLAEQHVTRAALRLNKTQPAISHALARLRALLDDPILVRRDGRFELTARALELAVPLREALALLGTVIGERAFDPATAEREFRLSLSDYAADVMLPDLARRLSRAAPGVVLRLVSLGREAALSVLRSGELDLAVGVYPGLASQADGLHFSKLFDDDFACLVDGAHRPPTTLDEYLIRPHIAVAASPDDAGEVDLMLNALGRSRRVAITLPHWSVAPRLVKDTDLILTAARRSLLAKGVGGVVIVAPPIDLAVIPLVQVWHVRRDFDQGLRWLREEIQAASAATDVPLV